MHICSPTFFVHYSIETYSGGSKWGNTSLILWLGEYDTEYVICLYTIYCAIYSLIWFPILFGNQSLLFWKYWRPKFQVNEAPNFCLQRGLFHSDRFIIIPEQKTFEPQYRPLTGTIMQMKLLLLEVQYFFFLFMLWFHRSWRTIIVG